MRFLSRFISKARVNALIASNRLERRGVTAGNGVSTLLYTVSRVQAASVTKDLAFIFPK